ncbi:MAG: tRNA (adenosine(37)-N6)-dimethylallyltransferase MiaA [Candidatus Omnitrophica bacterium]|nr:tRNA (adenosine(37)-N6)-dimethylallyltransferase MiaA [Candidatus Omnitrophota bacterium]
MPDKRRLPTAGTLTVQTGLDRPDIVVICGPSAVGKSAAAVEFARRAGGEIVSCDAMQVYKEIRIASDKPSIGMLEAVPHHLLDVVSVEEEFNVARYRELALQAIQDIRRRGQLPVICGGSGMYLMALMDGIFTGGEVPPDVRERVEEEVDRTGLAAAHDRLQEVDPESAARIRPGDRQRIVRALEVFEGTGRPISTLQKNRDGLWGKADIRICALERPREELYARVERRVEEMFSCGLVEEVQAVLGLRLTASAARLIGIPEVAGCLAGRYDLAQAKYLLKRNTRRYVKRQLTWFRRDQRLRWLKVARDESPTQTAEKISGFLASALSNQV